MAFPQASDYRPPIIPDGQEYDNPDNGKSYYWTQILLPEGSTVENATTIGGYWTVVCDEDKQADRFILKDGDKVEGELRWDKFKPASGSDPLENAYHGIKIASRDGGYIFVASTGGTYSEEELTTDLVPTTPTSIVNKAYVDAAVSPGVTLFGDGGKWRTLNEGSTIERYIYFQIAKKGSDSPYIPYGNVLYLDKLIAADGTLQ